MSDDAKVTVGADASGAERVAAVMKLTWREAGDALKSSIGSAASAVAHDLSSVAISAGKINFSSQREQVKEFEGSSARMAVAMRRDLEGVRGSVEATGVAIGKRPAEVTAWASSVGQLTYNLEGAAEGIKGISGLAAETGRSIEDYRGLAVTLGTVGRVGGDTADAVGRIAAQAEQLNVQGGVAAFADQIDGLRDTISQMAVSSTADFLKVTALAAELGKGLSPQAAQRVQQGAIGALTADPLRWERYLGRSITNEHGQVEAKDAAKILQDITEKTKKRFGKDARRVLMLNFGAETGAAMFGANYSEAAAAAGLGPSGKPADAQARLNQTDAGKRAVAEAELAKSSRELLGSSSMLGRAADALQKFAAHNPITSTFVATVLGTGMSTFLSGLGSSIATIMGGKGAGGAVGGVVDLATKGTGLGTAAKAVPIVGAGIAGFAAGWEMAGGQAAIDQAYNEQNNQKFAEQHPEQAKEMVRLKEIRDRARAAKGLTTLPGGYTPDAEDTKLAQAAAGGSKEAVAAFSSKLQKEGETKQDADRIAKAVADALKNVKFNVVNATGGPIEVTAASGNSPAAGSQH